MKKNITIHVDDEERVITIGSARKADGIRRVELMSSVDEMNISKTEKMVAFWLYPTCVCSVREPEAIKEMSFKDFVDKVDEADIDLWVKAAYECNPQWKASLENLGKVSEDDQKKILTPSPGSSTPTEAETTSSGISLTPTP